MLLSVDQRGAVAACPHGAARRFRGNGLMPGVLAEFDMRGQTQPGGQWRSCSDSRPCLTSTTRSGASPVLTVMRLTALQYTGDQRSGP